jgi:hypothetical protein
MGALQLLLGVASFYQYQRLCNAVYGVLEETKATSNNTTRYDGALRKFRNQQAVVVVGASGFTTITLLWAAQIIPISFALVPTFALFETACGGGILLIYVFKFNKNRGTSQKATSHTHPKSSKKGDIPIVNNILSNEAGASIGAHNTI